MKIEVIHSQWGADDEVYEAGIHDLTDAPENIIACVAGAEAAGSINVIEATKAERKTLDGLVQGQEDGEAAQEAAIADGSWQRGNLDAQLDAYRDLLTGHEDESAPLSEENLALVSFAQEQTTDLITRMDGGASYDEAVEGWQADKQAEIEAAARAGESVDEEPVSEEPADG